MNTIASIFIDAILFAVFGVGLIFAYKLKKINLCIIFTIIVTLSATNLFVYIATFNF